ncbi:C-Maf-inducing protein-like isoform X2 [Homarus americanus]|uniref:C-Maf-inducing protein-like isoform X2 n=1 Tax=Homarus americanus TaxID=6706 RepID=UPI001C45D7E5|nr:C-Maf-inducing protein-like isoform X2 [Homarus americanus]
MLAALQGGLYTSPSRPLPPTPPMVTPANGAAPAGPSPKSRHQLQYCDACNTACVFMNSRRRKFQARYEGYVLLKRVAALNMRLHLPYVMAEGESPPYHRRHSCGDVLDENGDPPSDNQNLQPQPPLETSPPTSYMRSQSHSEWLRPEDDAPPPWEKVVNMDEPCQLDLRPTTPTPTSTAALSPQPSTVGVVDPAGRKPRRHSAMMERLACGHQRLCRKKSRSQDNLVGRRGSGGGGPLRLNNSVIPAPAALTTSLSRSEGSIHNVHAVLSTVPITVDDVDVGVGGLRAEVGELARLPKRLLHRVTGEVGQLVFDLEGWREEYLVLTHTAIAARTSTGLLESLVPYSQIEEVHVVVPCGTSGHKFCVRVIVRDGALLLQANNSYTRDQWLHSIIWKKNVYKYRNVLRTAQRPEVLLKELKNLVELSLATPLHDHTVCRVPLELASSILTTGEKWLSRQMTEEIIVTLAPLLENNQPSPEICQFFSQHCTDNPRSCLVIDMFTPIIKRILKHNVDFGKYPYVRRFVQDYIQALNSQNDGRRVVHEFVHSMHGLTSTCPHLRVLPNLVAVCTAAVCVLVAEQKDQERLNSLHQTNDDTINNLSCYLSVLNKICEYDDWRPGLAQLLQPIPFPDVALADEEFIRQILPIVEQIGTDTRCEVHQMVLGTRDDKEGWLNVLCPSSLACVDEGSAWASILQTLITCCCKRKKFLGMLVKSLGACMLLALRGNVTAQDVLCLMLEWKLIEGSDQSLQVVTTLQSTPTGKRRYQALCDRQMHLRELQQKGGPRKLTLPSRSTDADVNRMLSSGSFGNLECLSLAFTRVTSACAEQLIKLPTLRYLNLWATQFGDVGLQLISEHLHKLQVLNLCETPVTDKGLEALAAIKSLRKLNLNSTSLSVQTFETLKETLPSLLEVDVRYTDAW